MSELEIRVKGCEVSIKDLKKTQDENYKDIRLDLTELRENHLVHMEDRLNKKIDSKARTSMWTYAIGVTVVGIVVTLFGILTLIGD